MVSSGHVLTKKDTKIVRIGYANNIGRIILKLKIELESNGYLKQKRFNL